MRIKRIEYRHILLEGPAIDAMHRFSTRLRPVFFLAVSLVLAGCGLFPSEKYYKLPESEGEAIVSFSLSSGFYTEDQSVTLSTANPSDEIYYSLDGSVPAKTPYTSMEEGIPVIYGGELYYAAIGITATTLIRARVYRNGNVAGKESVATYFMDETTTLPIFSIAMDPQALWDDYSGIYVAGSNPSNPNIVPYGPENYNQDWERPVRIEYFDATKTFGFGINAGVKIFGGWSRGFDQKSLAVFTRPEYGNEQINYDFFNIVDDEGSPIDTFSSLVLRNSGDDWYRTMFRDAVLQSLLYGMYLDRQAYLPSLVFINGTYWGIHNIREKVNEDYLASHYHNVDRNRLDILEGFESEIVAGDASDFKTIIDYVESNDMSLAVNYDYIVTKVDINNLLDYVITQVYINNTDWPFTNIKYWRPKTATGKWRWIIYDLDGSFGGKEWVTTDTDQTNNAYNDWDFDTLAFFLAEDGATDTATLFAALFTNTVFKDAFEDRFNALLSANFSNTSVDNKITQFQAGIASEIALHQAMWPDSCWPSGGWNAAVQVMRDFQIARHGYISSQIDVWCP